jgi:hypothetical protein
MRLRHLKEHWWRIEAKLKKIPYLLLFKLFLISVGLVLIVNIQLYVIDLRDATSAEYSRFIRNELVKKHEYIQQSATQKEGLEEYENMKNIHLKLSKEFLLCEGENKILKSHIEILVKQRR